MQKAVLYGIIAAAVVAGGVGIGVAIWSMNTSAVEPAIATEQSSNDNQVRVIKHAAGETEITDIPKRIIPLDTVAVEFLLSTDIEPVGAASIEEHKNWSPEISTKWRNVVDVGETWEPNFEFMAQLEPDLIIGMHAAHSEMYDKLSKIAPTILLDNWPEQGGPTMLQAVEQNTMRIADVLGRHNEGTAFLDRFNAKLEQNKNRLEQAGLGGARFILADVWVNQGEPILRLYVPNAQGSETLERMGLQNVVSPPADFQRFGNMRVSLESLAELDGPDVHFLYMQIPGEDPITSPQYWADNPVWKNLSFVKEDRVYPLGSINMFRGVLMLEKLADKTTEQLISGDEVNVIQHAMGETEITGTPTRVIALEMIYVENLLALGVQPVGVADIQDFKQWVNLEGVELDESVVEVGNRWEPNLETLAQLEPDLIIGHVSNNGAIYDKLSKIAPTLIFDPDTSKEGSPTQLEEMRQSFMKIADALGMHDRGVEVLERMDRTIADSAMRVSESGNTEGKFVLALGLSWEGQTYLRVYANNALAVGVMEQMGMENAWDVDRAFWGFSDASLEDLATVQDADFFYIALDDDNPFETTFKGNPVWENLEFVKEGRVYHLQGTVPHGGPISAEILAKKVAEVLTDSK